ncbi:MAG TPA: hypothetical protein VIV12_31380 [Streptosporangiaceae bacterium]
MTMTYAPASSTATKSPGARWGRGTPDAKTSADSQIGPTSQPSPAGGRPDGHHAVSGPVQGGPQQLVHAAVDHHRPATRSRLDRQDLGDQRGGPGHHGMDMRAVSNPSWQENPGPRLYETPGEDHSMSQVT